MDTFKIIVMVLGLGLALFLSVVAELLHKAQTTRLASRTKRQVIKKRSANPEDDAVNTYISPRL